MKIRTTEKLHSFQKKLYKSINAFDLQGLLMDENRNFTAAVEAIEFEDYEIPDFKNVFSDEELLAKYALADALAVPFFLIQFSKGNYGIRKVYKSSEDIIGLTKIENKNEKEFIDWWKQFKRTNQTHPLSNGAENRICNTIFDKVLRKHGLEWGGNIDGFIISKRKVVAIIDNITIGKASAPLDGYKADPALYFSKKGPKYETWLSSVKLASILGIPHFLFTLDGVDQNAEHIGFSTIRSLDKFGIYYVDDKKPFENILIGINNIKSALECFRFFSGPPSWE